MSGQVSTSCNKPGPIFLDTCGESLVGEIHQRQNLTLLEHLSDLPPLCDRRVNAGRIMARRVEADGIARGDCLQRGQQRVEVQANAGRIDVRISVDLQTGRLKHARMIDPRGTADPDAPALELLLEEIGRHAQGAGATRRLRRHAAPLADDLVIGAEQHLADMTSVFGESIDSQITSCSSPPPTGVARLL